MKKQPLTEGKMKSQVKRIGSNPPPPSTRPPPPPSPPPCRLIRESDPGPFCPQCGSSFALRYKCLKLSMCIQPECDNYFTGSDHWSLDDDTTSASMLCPPDDGDFETRTDQEILDDATVEADSKSHDIITFETVSETKERMKRLCDDLDKTAQAMLGTSPHHTSVRVAVGIISHAIRKEFL